MVNICMLAEFFFCNVPNFLKKLKMFTLLVAPVRSWENLLLTCGTVEICFPKEMMV